MSLPANMISPLNEAAIPPFPQTYNTLKMDTCEKQYEDLVNDQTYQYNSFLPSVWRPDTMVVQPLMRGSQPSFYGPMTGRRVTQESYLQGRGNVLSKCPDAGVNYLPPDLFNDANVPLTSCTSTLLEPTYQQYKKACDSLSNTDVGQLTTGTPKYGQPNTTGLYIQNQINSQVNMGSAPYKANTLC
jgi:hypothetical protein